MDDEGVRLHMSFGGRERAIVIPEARVEQLRRIWKRVLRAPFTSQTWRELAFYILSSALVFASLAFLAVTLVGGTFLVVTFLGLFLIAAGVRGARGIGVWQRALARSYLGEHIEEPAPFSSRPGWFGWLQTAIRDRSGWRAIAYTLAKVPLGIFGFVFALATWWSAFACLTYPFFGNGNPNPNVFSIFRAAFPPGFLSVGTSGVAHGLAILVTGVFYFFLAPWTVRAVVNIDRYLIRGLLGPDAVTARVRSLEKARAQTVDASAATLRRIERDLHDGTQAQLVALAMRLGQAKEHLEGSDVDVEQVRRLVDEAHGVAKEAIVELRDLARGIHPPVLDVGLEGALSTLASRSALPTELTFTVQDRPTPAIEAIAYFCVAELLANSTQHAKASRASVGCAQHGQWMRIVVRDDGTGGARTLRVGSSSSGLAGLADRVQAVDGHIEIVSPQGGPTVVTVDLPLHA
ncbi:MAG TPA: sensor domain-containing protein [Acidimicrobiales bacterium]|nr:sensor domain-containing protein [Acidimicrobiales bacterium]